MAYGEGHAAASFFRRYHDRGGLSHHLPELRERPQTSNHTFVLWSSMLQDGNLKRWTSVRRAVELPARIYRVVCSIACA
jgi:hypothetical protein